MTAKRATVFRQATSSVVLIALMLGILATGSVPKAAFVAPTSYYVSTAGNDSNPGTLASPWRTIQKAAASVLPGDTVYVRGGVYHEFVSLTRSGEAGGKDITFRNYKGEKPVLDGTGLSVSGDHAELFYLSGVSYVKIQGFEIRNLSASNSAFDPAGIRVNTFDGPSRNIQILANNVHHIQNTAPSNMNAHGILILGTSTSPMTNIVVSGNYIHHLITGWSESLTLSGNIDGFTVSGNRVHDNNNIGIELAGYYRACESCKESDDRARNGVVSENTVYQIDTVANPAYQPLGTRSAAGIYADGAANIVIERNNVYGNDFGIELASENAGKNTSNVVVRNNLIHHNLGAGFLMGGYDPGVGGSTGNKVINNTLVENDALKQEYGEIYVQHNAVGNTVENNIIYSNSQNGLINKVDRTGSDNVFDYNMYFSPGGAEASIWKWNGATYSSFGSYKTASGNDTHSVFANPKFVQVAARDFQLTAGSPAINKGITLSAALSGTYDYDKQPRVQGAAVDIGAYEFAFGKKKK